MELHEEELYGAIARGWCDERNSGKEMDVDLADAIAIEVLALVRPLRAELEQVREERDAARIEAAVLLGYAVPEERDALLAENQALRAEALAWCQTVHGTDPSCECMDEDDNLELCPDYRSRCPRSKDAYTAAAERVAKMEAPDAHL